MERRRKAKRQRAHSPRSGSKLRNIDTAEALQIIAGRLDEFRDGGSKSALVADLLGRTIGPRLLPYSKDLANDSALAARVTAEQAAKSEELEKGIRRLGNEFRVAAQELTLQLVPGMLRFIQAANDANRLKIDFGTKALFFNPFFSVNESLDRTRQQLADAIKKKEDFLRRTGTFTPEMDEDIAKLRTRLEFFKGIQARDALAIGGGDTPGEPRPGRRRG